MKVGIFVRDKWGGPYIRSKAVADSLPNIEFFSEPSECKKYDLVDLQFQFPIRLVFELVKNKIPFVITFHGFVPLKYCSNFRKKIIMVYHRFRHWLAFMFAKKIIAVSHFANSQIGNKGTVIHNGVDLKKFKYCTRKTKNKILFVNPPEKYENMRILEDARVKFEQHSYKKNEISHKGMIREMREAKILIQPALWESFGIPIIEAMASGTLVIASAIPSHLELFDNILFFNIPNDLANIRNLVEFFLEHPKLMSPITEKARKEVEEKYDVRDMVKKTKEVYDEAIK